MHAAPYRSDPRAKELRVSRAGQFQLWSLLQLAIGDASEVAGNLERAFLERCPGTLGHGQLSPYKTVCEEIRDETHELLMRVTQGFLDMSRLCKALDLLECNQQDEQQQHQHVDNNEQAQTD